MDDRDPVLLIFAPVYNLHAFPISDMPILTFAKAAVHHPRRTQERHVTLVQTRQRAPRKLWLGRMRHPPRLSPCGRIGQQIFEFIERKPTIVEGGGRTSGNDKVAVRNVGKRRNMLVSLCQIV